MRIVVATGLNTGAAEYQNMGDVAMLQVAVARLLRLWPNASIEVLTNSRSDLAPYCPSAKPLPRASCTCWVGDHILLGQFHQLLPKWASVRLSALRRAIGLKFPTLIEFLIRVRLSLRKQSGKRRDFKVFLDALRPPPLCQPEGSVQRTANCVLTGCRLSPYQLRSITTSNIYFATSH
jgi:hypothetical protein